MTLPWRSRELLTVREAAELLSLSQARVRRRVELVDENLVRDSGLTRGDGRCKSVVWEIVPADPQQELF